MCTHFYTQMHTYKHTQKQAGIHTKADICEGKKADLQVAGKLWVPTSGVSLF